MSDKEHHYDVDADSKTALRTDTPSLYKVVLLNDDFTPMEFVVSVLMKFFSKSLGQSTEIMLNVHHQGVGVCGHYPRDIAETKVNQVNRHSRDNGHPLKCTMEKA